MIDRHHIDLFEARRGFLTGLAYRIVGSLAEAEDAVQDTFLKWSQADRSAIANPAAWLTAACTRRAIDMLRAARRARVDYVGVWLPEPIQTATDDTPESAAELSSSLSMAFLLVLERLAPKERAAYLLHDIFDRPYAEVAAALGVQETTCRKLVSRARINVGKAEGRNPVPPERQEELLAAFRRAIATGETGPLAALMSGDVALRADGGGKVPAARQPLTGRASVLDFIRGTLGVFWKTYAWHPADINGVRGALLSQDGAVVGAVSFACDGEGRLADIFIMRNPDKLVRIARSAAASG